MTEPQTRTTPPLTIRRATARDFDAYDELWQGYLAHWNASQSPADAQAVFAKLTNPASDQARLFLAFLGQEAVGFVSVLRIPHTFSPVDSLFREDLFVAPAFRRRGIGAALMRFVFKLAADEGLSRVYWHTSTGNSARSMYEAVGGVLQDKVTYRVDPPFPL